MLSWVLMLVPIVVVIQPLAFWYVSVCNEKYPALPVDVEPHAFKVLLLSPFPAPKHHKFTKLH